MATTNPEAEPPPCTNCGQVCFSQTEITDCNDGEPWETCSGCHVNMMDMEAAIVRHATAPATAPGPMRYRS